MSLPTTMRAVVQHGPKDLRVEERPVPSPGPGQVLVRVAAGGICGSDLHAWEEAYYGSGVVLGHEIAGEVAGLGPDVSGLEPGALGAVFAGEACGRCERCQAGLEHYCRHGEGLGSGPYGGFGEYLLAPAESFLPAPASSDPGAVAFTEPLANGLRCMDFPEVRDARTALVVGAGPIGLSCLIAARRFGVDRVWVIEGRERRREAALALGAEHVLEPGEHVRGELSAAFPYGCDVVVEAVGHPQTIASAFHQARPGGTVVLMGVYTGTVELRPLSWILKELTMRTGIGCSRADQLAALELLAEGEVDIGALVTRRIPIEQTPEMVAALAGGADEIKVVVEHGRS